MSHFMTLGADNFKLGDPLGNACNEPHEDSPEAALVADCCCVAHAAGWYANFSANGYLDRTDYVGPFATAFEAMVAAVDQDGSCTLADECQYGTAGTIRLADEGMPGDPWFLFGHEFGPSTIIRCKSIEDADEIANRFREPATWDDVRDAAGEDWDRMEAAAELPEGFLFADPSDCPTGIVHESYYEWVREATPDDLAKLLPDIADDAE